METDRRAMTLAAAGAFVSSVTGLIAQEEVNDGGERRDMLARVRPPRQAHLPGGARLLDIRLARASRRAVATLGGRRVAVPVRAEAFAAIAPHLTETVLGAVKPTPQLIFACKSCPHFDECMDADIDDHIFVLPRLSEKRFEEIRHHERISNLPVTVELTAVRGGAFSIFARPLRRIAL